MTAPRVEFWFEYASTYSHLAALRVGAEAEARGVEVRWRPFLLGPIFGAQGWRESPFNLYPVKGRNMWRDMDRQAAKHGLPKVTRPDPFPASSLLVARATLALPEALRGAFAVQVFRAAFAEGRDIADPGTISAALRAAGVAAPAEVLAATQDEAVKDALKAQGAEAARLGIYGAPSFVCADGELFWGHDRMEDALDWAAGRAVRP